MRPLFVLQVAFPFGRGVCLSMVGKLLGDRPQGTWMGVTFALGAVARIAGPFWAVHGYRTQGALVVFGGTAALYLLSLVGVRLLGGTISTAGLDARLGHHLPPGSTPPRGGGARGAAEPQRRLSITSSPVCDPRPGSSTMATFGMSPAMQLHETRGRMVTP